MAFRSSYPQVYSALSKLPEKEIHRVQADVLRMYTQAIGSVHARIGIVNYIIQHRIHELAEYIRQNKLTYHDSDKLIEWIRQRTSDCNVNQAVPSNDGRR